MARINLLLVTTGQVHGLNTPGVCNAWPKLAVAFRSWPKSKSRYQPVRVRVRVRVRVLEPVQTLVLLLRLVFALTVVVLQLVRLLGTMPFVVMMRFRLLRTVLLAPSPGHNIPSTCCHPPCRTSPR